MIYCTVATEAADELHEGLRRFFSARQDVEVVVERPRDAEQGQPDRGYRAIP